jgi:hypothetical protein
MRRFAAAPNPANDTFLKQGLLKMKETTYSSQVTSTGSSTAYVARDPVIVKLLTDPTRAQFFLAFLGRDASPAQVARELKVSLSRTMYWVTRAMDAGLLVVSRTEERAGRPVRFYRCCADALFLPADATEVGTLTELLRLWSDPWQQLFVESVARTLRGAKLTGIRFSRTATGRLEIKYASGPEANADLAPANMPAVWGGWYTDVWLTQQDAKALQLELRALQKRFLAKSVVAPDAQRFIMRLALAPCAPTQLASSE